MTRDLHDLLTESARAPRTAVDSEALWQRGRARRRGKQVGTAVAVVALLGVVAGVSMRDDGTRLIPAPPIIDQPDDAIPDALPTPSFEAEATLETRGTPLDGATVKTETYGEELPPKDGAGENPCCLVVHRTGPALVDNLKRELRVHEANGVFMFSMPEGTQFFASASLPGGAVALLGHHHIGMAVSEPSTEVVVFSGDELPSTSRFEVPEGTNAIAAGHGGLWAHLPEGWAQVADEDGAPLDEPATRDRLVLRDGTAVEAEETPDGSAVLHSEYEGGGEGRLEIRVPDRRVVVEKIEALDAADQPHVLLAVIRVDGGDAPEHRLLGIDGGTVVDFGSLAPGDTWAGRLAITPAGELYHLHSDDVGITLTRYEPDLARLGGDRSTPPPAEETAAVDVLDPWWLPDGTPPLAVVEGDGSVIRLESGDARRFRAPTPYLSIAFDDDGVLHASRLEGTQVVFDRLDPESSAVEVLRLPRTSTEEHEGHGLSDGERGDSFAVVGSSIAVVARRTPRCPEKCPEPIPRHDVELHPVDGGAPRIVPIPEATGEELEVRILRGDAGRVLLHLIEPGEGSIVGLVDVATSEVEMLDIQPGPPDPFAISIGGANASGERTDDGTLERILLGGRTGPSDAEILPSSEDGGAFAPVLAVTDDLTVAYLECGACEGEEYQLILYTHADRGRHPLLFVTAPRAVELAPVR